MCSLYGGGDLAGKSFQTIITYDTAALSPIDIPALDMSVLLGSGASAGFSIYSEVGGIGRGGSTALGTDFAVSQGLLLSNGATNHNALLPFDQVVTGTNGTSPVAPFELFGPGTGFGPDHVEYSTLSSISSFSPLIANHSFADSFTVTKGLTDASFGYINLYYQGFVIENLNLNPQTISFSSVTPVPEPETYTMFLAGLGLMGAVIRARKK
jgi:PEP-CTERM motif